MANPFYIAPQQRTNRFANLAEMGLKLYELQQRQRISGDELAAKKEDLAFRRTTEANAATATADYRIKTFDETKRHNLATEAQNKKHMALTPIPDGRAATISAQIRQLGEGAGIKKTAIEPVVDYFTELQQAGGSPDAIWRVFKRNWGQISAPIVEDLTGQLEKLVKESAAIPGEAPKAKLEKLENLITAMKDPDFTDALFPTASAFDAERLDTEKRLQQRALELKKAGPAKEQYSEPFKDEYGNLVQRNLSTGKIQKVSAPGSQTVIRTNADGTTEVILGAKGGAGTLTKPTQTQIEKDRLIATEAIQKVGSTINLYKGKFNTAPFRAKVKWEELRQIMGKEADPEINAELRDFKGWYTTAMRDYAIAVQSLGKGNLTKNEEKLYGAGLPDPGGVFFGLIPKNAPQTYFDTLVKRYRGLNALVARQNYYLGILKKTPQQYIDLVSAGKVESVSDMADIIDARQAELQAQNPQDDLNTILQKLKIEFGIGQ